MLRQSGEALILSVWYEDTDGNGVALSPVPTVKIEDPDGNLVVNGSNMTARTNLTGMFDYVYNPGGALTAGRWAAVASTSSTDVVQQQRPSILDVGVAGIDHLDADVSSRSSHSAADVWAATTRTLSSFGTLIADIWAYVTRTLTGWGSISAPPTASEIEDAVLDAANADHLMAGSIGKAISDAGESGATAETIAAAILDAVRTAHVTDDTIGEAVDYMYRKLASPGALEVASPYYAGVITLTPGDAYADAHENAISIPIGSAPDLSGAALSFLIEGTALSVPTVSGSGTSRVASVELTAAQTWALLEDLPIAGLPGATPAYWSLVATWSDAYPQTLAGGKVRRTAWSREP